VMNGAGTSCGGISTIMQSSLATVPSRRTASQDGTVALELQYRGVVLLSFRLQ